VLPEVGERPLPRADQPGGVEVLALVGIERCVQDDTGPDGRRERAEREEDQDPPGTAGSWARQAPPRASQARYSSSVLASGG
jgi:hypothetical protein